MTVFTVRGFITACVVLALPAGGAAQEAGIGGTVADATGAVLPGVTVTAVNEASGNSFEASTDGRGVYRIAVRPGVYRVTGQLAGFTTVVRPGLELLLGQQIVVNFEMAVSAVAESVTVTGEAPLLDTTSSVVSSSIDPRQMQELPLQGRNWMDLVTLAPSSRTGNAATEVPQDRQGFFQVNVDGQQVTQLICCSQQQPRFSRDAISEFELITNRFDATMGRSQGMVVNAVTKSGTNQISGTVSGYFRDDAFSAADFIQQRVIPYANQQFVGTFGGPIRIDRIHYFTNYEYEREPQTVTFNSPYPSFNIDLPGTRRQHTGIGKMDAQFTSQSRLAVRYAKYFQEMPNQNTGGATTHPSAAQDIKRQSDQVWSVFTQVLSNRALNEIKGGWSDFHWALTPSVRWAGGGPFGGPSILGGGTPRIDFSGYSIGTASNSPQDIAEDVWTIRDDFSFSFDRAGRHDVKAGGEYFRWHGYWKEWCNRCNGVFRITARPPANVEQLFPVYNDSSTWNLAALSPLVVNYEQSVGNHSMDAYRDVSAFWLQDDWTPFDRLTINAGVRYDLDLGVLGENIELRPWMSGDRPSDLNNVAPRLGFAYRVTERTVIRGGYGRFFTQLESDAAHQSQLWTQTVIPQVLNDGRPDFATNPFNGPRPTYEQVMATACDRTNNRVGCLRRSITIEIPSPVHEIGYSHQASIGAQRQLGATMAMEVNYVWTGGRKEEVNYNMNLAYNPATGANYPFTDRTRLPFPDWGLVLGEFMVGRSNYHGLESSFTKRFGDRWQAQGTYTLSGFWDSPGDPSAVLPDGSTGIVARELGFPLAADLGEEYTLGASDQRHRATFSGIWDIGRGVQLSGMYFFGSGERISTNWGSDVRSLGTNSRGPTAWGIGRLRPDGTLVPRNAFVGSPIHRIDMRLQKRIRLAGRATIDAMAEAFNLFNHENYGSYTASESSASYGQPSFNPNTAYRPRTAQFGFRVAF